LIAYLFFFFQSLPVLLQFFVFSSEDSSVEGAGGKGCTGGRLGIFGENIDPIII
jgi:hypothetical protein